MLCKRVLMHCVQCLGKGARVSTRHGQIAIKKPQHFCWGFLNTLNLDRGLG
jgi:hypothetical protein